MVLYYRRWILRLLFPVLLLTGLCSPPTRSAAQDDPLTDETRQIEIAQRFLTVLEQNPRRGTALDRVFGHHVEFGTLDDFVTQLRKRVTDKPDDGTGWMLLGLIESQRGENASAADSFQQAEIHRPQDGLASYYLGQELLLIGKLEEAVAAFELGIERNPPRADLLEIFQQLGRVHQRAQRTEAAMAVWQRLENLFPDDLRVQEQIARVLEEDGQFSLARPRYERLVTLVKDDYRRVVFEIEVAELKIREKQRDAGLADFERILSNLSPESWLQKDVRRRIEDVFLRAGDQDGLVIYYTSWLEKHTDDFDGMSRLARFLASSGRVPEASLWMEKALKLAPTRSELRRTFISQLVDDQRFPDALKQYELLAQNQPGNADVLREWGRLVLRDKSQEMNARQIEASRIWNQIITEHPEDALSAAQVADLFRQANMPDDAIRLYRKSVELAPDDPQYREYLGEYFHILKRTDEAFATWTAIAEGSRRNATNVMRLAEVFNSFGYLDQAVIRIDEACELDTKDFSLRLKSAEYHSRAGSYDAALSALDVAETLVANDDDRESVLKQKIDVYASAQRLQDEIEKLDNEITKKTSPTANDWHLLAHYYEADRQWPEANESIQKAVAIAPQSIPELTTAARIAEASGEFAQAADYRRQLAVADRRSRSEHLVNLARLESQMGRVEQALAAGQELIVSAPGNTENYEFYAQLCFRLGKSDEGLNALRKAVRINPGESHLITSLAAALADQFRTEEAIEVYWRAFEKTDEIDDKTSLTMRLAELYLQINQFDKLIERFERDRREDEKRREATICLAQANHTAGDFAAARQELESLFSENTRDTKLLQQLSKLCEESADVDAAVEYQRQLVGLAPGDETEFRLANMLLARGDFDEASEIIVKLTQREQDPSRLLRNLGTMLGQGRYESVLRITEPLLGEQRDNWELLYLEGVALAYLNRIDEAKTRFQRVLALNLPHENMGVLAAARLKQAQAKAKSDNLRGLITQVPTVQSPFELCSHVQEVKQGVGLVNDSYYPQSRRQAVWAPEYFGLARMAAYAWFFKFAKENPSAPESGDGSKVLFDDLLSRSTVENAPRDALYDAIYVALLQDQFQSVFEIAKKFAVRGGKDEEKFYLQCVTTRTLGSSANGPRIADQETPKTPLNNDDLELMLKCYQSLKDSEAEKNATLMQSGSVVVASNGQIYVQMPNGQYVSAGSGFGLGFLDLVVSELELAGRTEHAAELLNDHLAKSKSSSDYLAGMQLMVKQKKWDRISATFAQWAVAAKKEITESPTNNVPKGPGAATATALGQSSTFLISWLGNLGPEEEHGQMLEILDQTFDVGELAFLQNLKNRPTRPRSSGQSPQRGYNQATFSYGSEQFSTSWIFPVSYDYVDFSAVVVMRQVLEVFKRNNVIEDFPAHLQKRLESADNDLKPYRQLCLGYALWWTDQQDEAIAVLTDVAKELPADPVFRMEIATLNETMGNFDEALQIVDSIIPRDQKVLQIRELVALRIAERLGDTDRAHQAAERLFGMRLDNNVQMELVDRLARLGLHDMANAVLTRIERQSGNQPQALASLMTLYRGQGKTAEAQQVAWTLLRRTSSPYLALASSVQNPMRYQTADSSIRAQALLLLQQTGALTPVIARLEAQLAQSPDSPKFVQQLIEYYLLTNERAKLLEMLEAAVNKRPDIVGFRHQLAKQLEASGKTGEACDQYLEILRKQPSWLANDFYQLREVFERAKRGSDLADTVKNMDFRSFGSPYYVVDFAANLANDEKNLDTVVVILEKIIDQYPSYRSQALANLRNSKLWQSDKLFNLAKKALVPTAAEIAANNWLGIDQINSWSGSGKVNSMFSEVLAGISDSGKVAELKQLIEERVQMSPNWYGGQFMLVLLDLKVNRRDDAQNRLELLTKDEKILKIMSVDAKFIVSQELDKFDSTRDLANRMIESTISAPQRISNLEYSPLVRLITNYERKGETQAARDLILKLLNENRVDNQDPIYSLGQKHENAMWAAKRLIQLGFAVDALRLHREILTDGATLDAVVAYGSYGNNKDSILDMAAKTRSDAIAKLGEKNIDLLIEQLLDVPDKLADGIPAINLLLIAPDIQNVQKKPLESDLLNVLVSAKVDADGKRAVVKRLEQLRIAHPQDFSVAVAYTLELWPIGGSVRSDALNELAAVVEAVPLEELPVGRRPNARQRRIAAQSIPLWLVARECMKVNAATEIAEKLAQRALLGAKRQESPIQTAAILREWGQIALQNGNREMAQSKWNEMLDAVTSRPKRTQKPLIPGIPNGIQPQEKPSTDGKSSINVRRRESLVSFSSRQEGQRIEPRAPVLAAESVPPLTISQFRLSIQVAEMAAENEMPDLSMNAVRACFVGGAPVSDPKPSTSTANTRAMRSSPGQLTVTESQQIELEAAREVVRVVKIWANKNYSPKHVHELLSEIVFPNSKPTEILLYGDSSRLSECQLTSVGAALVEWADKSGRLDELDAQITARIQNPNSRVTGLVLQTLSAIRANKVDIASDRLNELAKMVDGMLPTMVQVASHAALPAAADPALSGPANAILMRAAQLPPVSQDERTITSLTLGKLSNNVIRHLAKTGDQKSVETFFESFLAQVQQQSTRYGGDYGITQQAAATTDIANEAASNDMPQLAFKFMGRAADFAISESYRQTLRTSLVLTSQYLNSKSPAERYQIWCDWTLPDTNRQSIRFISVWGSPIPAPEAFLEKDRVTGALTPTLPISNFTELISAAQAAGQLENLIERVSIEVEKKIANAEVLYALALIAKKDVVVGEPVIRRLMSTFDERAKLVSRRAPDLSGDALLFLACMKSPEFADIYRPSFRKLTSVLQTAQQGDLGPWLTIQYANALSIEMGAAIKPGDDFGLKYWQAATTRTEAGLGSKPWWVSHEGQLVHITGVGADLLHFAYPVEGDFEFSVDCFDSPGTESDAGYDGVFVEAQSARNYSMVWSADSNDSFMQSIGPRRTRNQFNRVIVQSSNGRFRYLLNNHVVYEGPIYGTSPWITLYTDRNRITAFRNLTLKGNPVIPREVNLIRGECMNGWSTRFFLESQPRRRTMALVADKSKGITEDNLRQYQQREPAKYDWIVNDSLLIANPSGDAVDATQSWIYYHRPLANHEVVRYEFFYEPGKSVAHPTIGRVAILMEPDGIVAHYIQGNPRLDPRSVMPEFPVSSDNRVTEPQCRRGAADIPLKPNDWNQVELALKDRVVTLSLNGLIVYERGLEPQLDQRFGLFRWKHQSCKVRNIKLSGPWPETLSSEISDNLLASDKPVSDADRGVIHELLTDAFIEPNIPDVVSKARAMAPAEAMDFLTRWVLPSTDHSTVRVYFRFAPYKSAKDLNGSDPTGERLLCPAWELVKAAIASNQVIRLEDEIENLSLTDPVAHRGKLALQFLLSLGKQDIDGATKKLVELKAILMRGLPEDLPNRDRSSEFVAIWFAASNPVLRNDARQLLTMIIDAERAKKEKAIANYSADWLLQVEALAGRLDKLDTDEAGEGKYVVNDIPNWTAIPLTRPETRAKGYRPAQWVSFDGKFVHLPGETWGQLYFRSPLQGDFEIKSRRDVARYNELTIAYGGHCALPRYDLKAIQVSNTLYSFRNIDRAVELPNWTGDAEFRVVVAGNKITTLVNGIEINQEHLSQNPDPWLVLTAPSQGSRGTISGLEIIGEPLIPTEIDLLASSLLAGWQSDTYSERLSDDTTQSPVWTRFGDELIGEIRTDRSASLSESLLSYRRPMLEDGEINFETFFKPGEFEVSPAIGRSAIVLSPDGVKLHRLTDAPWENGDLMPGNLEELKGSTGPVPLRANDWNQISLSLKGNVTNLMVNGKNVATFEIDELPEERTFGLFRYSDKTKCRVRNAVYRGEWPKSLPK